MKLIILGLIIGTCLVAYNVGDFVRYANDGIVDANKSKGGHETAAAWPDGAQPGTMTAQYPVDPSTTVVSDT